MSVGPGDKHRIDKAAWRRYAAGNKDRCVVCGHSSDVVVTMTAMERAPEGQGRGTGAMLAKQQFRFCSEHGQLRFGDALNKLNGVGGR